VRVSDIEREDWRERSMTMKNNNTEIIKMYI
jgi:hypothetical protein